MHCQIHFSALMYYAYIYRGLSESIMLLLDAIVVLFPLIFTSKLAAYIAYTR